MTAEAVVTPLSWSQKRLADLFELEQDGGSFLATTHDANLNGRVFGGQLLGQALAAAQRHSPDFAPATLHCLFLRGARPDQALHYRVTPLQQGKRFVSLHVCGVQGQCRVVDVQVTLQAPVSGFFHIESAAGLPGPEQLGALDVIEDGRWARFVRPFVEVRVIEPQRHFQQCAEEPSIAYWVRLRESLPSSPAVHAQALAYLSDYWINSGTISYHVPIEKARERLFVSSLNHSLWFHGPVTADDWLLFVCDSPSMQRGRSLTRVGVYDQSRNLVASIAQDCLIGEREQNAGM